MLVRAVHGRHVTTLSVFGITGLLEKNHKVETKSKKCPSKSRGTGKRSILVRGCGQEEGLGAEVRSPARGRARVSTAGDMKQAAAGALLLGGLLQAPPSFGMPVWDPYSHAEVTCITSCPGLTTLTPPRTRDFCPSKPLAQLGDNVLGSGFCEGPCCLFKCLFVSTGSQTA